MHNAAYMDRMPITDETPYTSPFVAPRSAPVPGFGGSSSSSSSAAPAARRPAKGRGKPAKTPGFTPAEYSASERGDDYTQQSFASYSEAPRQRERSAKRAPALAPIAEDVAPVVQPPAVTVSADSEELLRMRRKLRDMKSSMDNQSI